MTENEKPAGKPARQRGVGRLDWSTWPVYEGAVSGLPNYWYPVIWSKDVTTKPQQVMLLGQKIMLQREGDKVYALHDRCPHRGVPLSLGTREFPGTVSCPYHGWTFELGTGKMCAAITDGPNSPIAGKVSVSTYPVEERLGLVWVFVGDGSLEEVPPVETDIPEELLAHPVTIGGRIVPGRGGNWRYAAENGFDEGHAKYLHRNALFSFFRQMPVWNESQIVRSEDKRWIARKQKAMHWEADFPGLGPWSQKAWWRFYKKNEKPGVGTSGKESLISQMGFPGMVSIRLPATLRVALAQFVHYEWAVPEGPDSHRYIQLLASFDDRPGRSMWFRAKYLAFIRWVFHGQFTGQDAWMVDVMEVPPERLYRPDVSVTEYRKLVEEQHRTGKTDQD